MGLGAAFMFGQMLGTVLSDSANNQQVNTSALQRAQALNDEGIRLNNRAVRQIEAKNYQRAAELFGSSISQFQQCVKVMPESKTAQTNLTTARKNLLIAQIWIAYDPKNLERLIDYSKKLLRYEPGNKELKQSIDMWEQQLAEDARWQKRVAEAPGVPLQRGWLGVRLLPVTDEKAASLSIKPARGVLVSGIDSKGPAEAAGIVVGDVIVKFDGIDIKEIKGFSSIVSDTPVGKDLEIVIIRRGIEEKKIVKLGTK